MTAVDGPDGFEPFAPSSPYLDRLGPVWVDRRSDPPVFAVRVAGHHLNNKGTAHGGLLSALADIVCGYTVHWSREPGPDLVTVHLATEYLGAARAGEWLTATAEVGKLSRHVACSHAMLRSGDRLVAQATALFQVRPAAGEGEGEGGGR